jgi:hypothetical protein
MLSSRLKHKRLAAHLLLPKSVSNPLGNLSKDSLTHLMRCSIRPRLRSSLAIVGLLLRASIDCTFRVSLERARCSRAFTVSHWYA